MIGIITTVLALLGITALISAHHYYEKLRFETIEASASNETNTIQQDQQPYKTYTIKDAELHTTFLTYKTLSKDNPILFGKACRVAKYQIDYDESGTLIAKIYDTISMDEAQTVFHHRTIQFSDEYSLLDAEIETKSLYPIGTNEQCNDAAIEVLLTINRRKPKPQINRLNE